MVKRPELKRKECNLRISKNTRTPVKLTGVFLCRVRKLYFYFNSNLHKIEYSIFIFSNSTLKSVNDSPLPREPLIVTPAALQGFC